MTFFSGASCTLSECRPFYHPFTQACVAALLGLGWHVVAFQAKEESWRTYILIVPRGARGKRAQSFTTELRVVVDESLWPDWSGEFVPAYALAMPEYRQA